MLFFAERKTLVAERVFFCYTMIMFHLCIE